MTKLAHFLNVSNLTENYYYTSQFQTYNTSLLIYKHDLSHKSNTGSIIYYCDSVNRLVDTTITALGLK
jgi:hypothetical protein